MKIKKRFHKIIIICDKLLKKFDNWEKKSKFTNKGQLLVNN